MRTILLLGLCILLTSCATPELRTLEKRDSTQVSPRSTMQPIVAASLDSNEPLYLWNEAQHHYEIHLVDPATGQDVPGHTPFVVGENTQYTGAMTLSASGERIAIAAGNGDYCYSSGGGIACMGRAHVLHIIDREGWREVTAMLPGEGWSGLISFSPDSRQLALIFSEQKSNTVMLFEASTGNLIAGQELAFSPSLMEYTADGRTLVLYGQPMGLRAGIAKPDPPSVVLLDATNLEIKWEQELPSILSGYWCLEKCDQSHGEQTFAEWLPAVVLSPDRNRLYIVHADDDQLTTVDFNTRTVKTVEIQKAQSWFERLLSLTAQVAHAKGNFNGVLKAGVISPDGTRLYVVGQAMRATPDANDQPQETDESLGLEVVEAANGKKLSGTDSRATWIKITPDGAHLILGNWGEARIDVLDSNSLKSVAVLQRYETVTNRSMNERPVVLASRSGQGFTELAVLDPETFNIIRSWSIQTSYAAWISTP